LFMFPQPLFTLLAAVALVGSCSGPADHV